MDVPWRIQLFGGLAAVRGERRVTRFRSQNTAALLAYLAYHRHRSHPRPVLIELLWPGCDPELGRHNLSVALSRLRDQFELAEEGSPGGVFIADRSSVGMNAAAIITDTGEFEAALQHAAAAGSDAERARVLSEAVDLYRGALLPGYYEEWILPEQQRLDELFFQALRQLIAEYEKVGEFGRALQYARRAVSVDPLREEAHRETMRLYAAAGEPSAAVRQYRELERILNQELDTTPGAATRALLRSLESLGSAPASDRPAPPDGSPAEPPCYRDPTPLSQMGFYGPGASRTLPDASLAELEPAGGAVPLSSPFYVVRDTDEQFGAAIARRESIVLVKGPRQVGKTSLLARGLQRARQAGARVVLTDLDAFNAAQMASAEALLLALAQSIADQLEIEISPGALWDAGRGPNVNFQRFMRRHVFRAIETPLVWGLDGVDRLFRYDFGTEIFALFRAWHNERALEPASPWTRLTLAIAYATEAHLFITDLNRSPFNVGVRLTLDDFTLEQVADLNDRYGAPLKGAAEVARYDELVGGHPYLVRRGLDEMTAHGTPLTALAERAASDTWIFGHHLHRVLDRVTRDSELCAVVRDLLAGRSRVPPRSFYRLRSAGVLSGDAEDAARLRCRLYALYLERHLSG